MELNAKDGRFTSVPPCLSLHLASLTWCSNKTFSVFCCRNTCWSCSARPSLRKRPTLSFSLLQNKCWQATNATQSTEFLTWGQMHKKRKNTKRTSRILLSWMSRSWPWTTSPWRRERWHGRSRSQACPSGSRSTQTQWLCLRLCARTKNRTKRLRRCTESWTERPK